MKQISIDDIQIRTQLKPGDLGYVIYRHGKLYSEEHGFGIAFEAYVAAGLYEFYTNYDPARDGVWICEHQNQIVGFVVLMHRENKAAQLRYFYLEPGYRGIGLGKKLMQLYMNFLREKEYQSSYLLTTSELKSAAALYVRHGFVLTSEKESGESGIFGRPLIEQRYDLLNTKR